MRCTCSLYSKRDFIVGHTFDDCQRCITLLIKWLQKSLISREATDRSFGIWILWQHGCQPNYSLSFSYPPTNVRIHSGLLGRILRTIFSEGSLWCRPLATVGGANWLWSRSQHFTATNERNKAGKRPKTSQVTICKLQTFKQLLHHVSSKLVSDLCKLICRSHCSNLISRTSVL